MTWRSKTRPSQALMFTVTQRLLLTTTSLPTAASVTLPSLFAPETCQPTPARGAGKEEGLLTTLSPTPKPERARQHQLLQTCLPRAARTGGQGWDRAEPQVPALQSLSPSEGAEVRPKEELRNVLFMYVCDQAAPPSPRFLASFSLVYFSHCKFLVQTQRKN